MKAKIKPVGVFPKTATVICITAVEQTQDNESKVSWHLLDDADLPLKFGDVIVDARAYQKWGAENEVVLALVLEKLQLEKE